VCRAPASADGGHTGRGSAAGGEQRHLTVANDRSGSKAVTRAGSSDDSVAAAARAAARKNAAARLSVDPSRCGWRRC
jgi:hypothetical protein